MFKRFSNLFPSAGDRAPLLPSMKATNGVIPQRVSVTGIEDASNTPASISPVTPIMSRRKGEPYQIVDPSAAMKSVDLFSRSALNFINGGGFSDQYSEQQMLNAYFTSVYMFAALRRVANLISRVKIVAEIKNENGGWQRAKNNHPLNEMFARDGSSTLHKMYLNFAVYGSTLVYKTKTRKAVHSLKEESPIYRFDEGAVAGLYTLDKPMWSIDEYYQGEIKGFFVNRVESSESMPHLMNETYLNRDEVIFYTDWNPERPNHGRSLVATAIHEATANAAIAQWMAEYFTRGAMPMLLVTMEEEEPQLITDADLMKYKRQFEEYQQGISSSLRTYFLDRKVAVEQIGISADEVSAPDLNEAALEGIASTVGIDRKLIVTTDGGAYAEQVQLVKSAWENTIIPLAEQFVMAFNRDLGIDNSRVRLILDLSDIRELEADREDRSNTEISIYEAAIQSFNETRTRIGMQPIPELEGYMNYDGKPTHISSIVMDSKIPTENYRQYVMDLYEADMILKSVALQMLGFKLPEGHKDGYKSDIENHKDLIRDLWESDLLKRSEVIRQLGFIVPADLEDGYRSELERGADYADYITQLWGDDLLTRSQVIQLLDLEVELPKDFVDGYQSDISERQDKITSLYSDNLITRRDALQLLGLRIPDNMVDGFSEEIDRWLDKNFESEETMRDFYMSLWNDNLIRRSDLLKAMKLPVPEGMIDGFQDEVNNKLDEIRESEQTYRDFIFDLYDKDLIPKSGAIQELEIPYVLKEAPDGYNSEVEMYTEKIADAKVNKILKDLGLLEEEATTGESASSGGAPSRPSYRSYRTAPTTIPTIEENLSEIQDVPKMKPSYDDILNTGVNQGQADISKNDREWHEREKAESLRFSSEKKVGKKPRKKLKPSKPSARYSADDMKAFEDEYVESFEGDWEDLVSYYGSHVDLMDMPQSQQIDDTFAYPSEMYGEFDSALPSQWLSSGNVDDYYEGLRSETSEEVYDDFDMYDQDFSNDDEALREYDEYSEFKNDDNLDQTIDERYADNLYDITENEEGGESSMHDVPQNNELYANIGLPKNEVVTMLQSRILGKVKMALGMSNKSYNGIHFKISPIPADKLHMTLFWAENVPDDIAQKLYDLLPNRYDVPVIECVDFGIFQGEDRHAIYIEVKRNAALDSIQQSIVGASNALGLKTSKYTRLDNWTPHITIAYIETDRYPEMIKRVLGVNFDVNERLLPKQVCFQRDGYRNDYIIPLSVRQIHDNQREIEAEISKLHHWRYGLPQNGKTIRLVDMWESLRLSLLNFIVESDVEGAPKISQSVFNILSDAMRNKKLVNNNVAYDVHSAIKSVQQNRNDELRAWRKVASRSLDRGLRFENVLIDDITSGSIKSALSQIGDKKMVYNVFGQYLQD